MRRLGRHGGSGSAVISKEEAILQKKGIENMTLPELHLWLEACVRNEKNVAFNKARRGWKNAKEATEIRINLLSNLDAKKT